MSDLDTGKEERIFGNFYGPGSLTIQAKEGESVKVKSVIQVSDCTVPITMKKINLGEVSSVWAMVMVKNTPIAVLDGIIVDGNNKGATNGFCSTDGSYVIMRNCEVHNCDYALTCSYSFNTLYDCTGTNNNIGIVSAGGGIVTVDGTTPTLMGGAANANNSGLIIKNNGTLL